MKRTWLPLSFALLALVAVPALAVDGTSQVAATQDPAAALSFDTLDDVLETGLGGVTSQSSCSAQCVWSSISCPSGTTSCSAQDVNCNTGQAGYIDCNGQRTYCGNAKKWFQTSACCYGLHLWEERSCGGSTGWYWQNTGYTDCLVQCGGGPLL